MAEPELTPKETRVTRGTKAEGEVSFQSSENAYAAPKITPEKARNYFEQNIHLATQIVNLLPQVFPGAPDVYVEDRDLERVDDLSKWVARVAEEVGIYPSMKISWIDTMSHGCSVKSAGYVFRNGRYEIDEIRDLPAITFRQPPRATGLGASPPNPLMPGIVWDANAKKVRAYQTVDDQFTLTELKNFTIIRDPSTPFPAGRAYCLPAYHVIGAIDHANKAADQQVHRVGAPLIFPQITETITQDLKAWGDNFVRKWGKDTGFIIPPGIGFPDVKIRENQTAADRLKMLVSWLEVYFNPTTVLRSGAGTVIGASDSGAMRVWNNYIGGTQAWIEEQYEAFLQPVLAANGYDDLNVRIQLKRPELDRSEVIVNQLRVGIEGRALTRDDIRRNLSELDLGELTDEVRAELDATYAAAPSMIFENLAGFSRKEGRPISAAERKIAAANLASLRAIEKILEIGGE
jgi:hypothetical protein